MSKDELINITCYFLNNNNANQRYIQTSTDGRRFICGAYQTDLRHFLNQVKDMDYWDTLDSLRKNYSSDKGTDITEELLLSNGFVLKTVFYEYFEKRTDKFTVILTKEMSNMVGRNWNMHIDNDRGETIGSANVQTTYHIKQLCELFDIDVSTIISSYEFDKRNEQ